MGSCIALLPAQLLTLRLRFARRLDRLLALTAAADEVSYIQQLARSGTPEERELLGMTVCRARGKWLTNATRAEAMAKLSEAERKALSNEMGAGGAKAIAEWWEAGGRSLGEEEGWKFP